VSHFDLAAPFIVTAILLAVGTIVTKMVERRMASIYERWSRDQYDQPKRDLPIEFSPKTLALLTGFITDAGQSLSLVIAPCVGLLLVDANGLGTLAIVLYVVAILGGICTLGYFMITEHPDRYSRHTIYGIVTPLALVGIAINAIFAGILLVAGT
jgi:hypothetical protein